MKRISQLFTAATVTTLVAGGAVAATSHTAEPYADVGNEAPRAVMDLGPKAHGATKPFAMHAWERGPMLELIQPQGAEAEPTRPPIIKHRWERGEMLKLMRQGYSGQVQAEGDPASANVRIYFDSTASEPGLPRSLGNTNVGRSIMLRYLEQARGNAPSS